MEFFLTASVFFFINHEFSMAGSEATRQFEWAKIDFYSLVLTKASSFLSEPLHRHLKEVLRSFGSDEIYDESSARLETFFAGGGFEGIAQKAVVEGIQPPFRDSGPVRRVGWEQLGIRWFVEWELGYQTTLAGEGLCATLQILLADLRDSELSLIRSDVTLRVETSASQTNVIDVSDNDRVSLIVHIPGSSANEPESAQFLGLVASILKTVSATPRTKFLAVFDRRMKEGLGGKITPFAEYGRLFREFYSESAFVEHYANSIGLTVDLPMVAAKTERGLEGPTGLHPEYDQRASTKAIIRRYARLPGQLRFTLPRLLQGAIFSSTVRELRIRGWKDWHILIAAASIRLNYVMHQHESRHADISRVGALARELFERDEVRDDPQAPDEMFTVAGMEGALPMTQVSTLEGLRLEFPQRVPNFRGIDLLLRRFNYWEDDEAHHDPFPGL
jgi:hypothetical protein